MKTRLFQTTLLLIIFALMVTSPLVAVLGADAEYSSPGNYDRTYTFDVQYGFSRFSHKLYTSMTPSLYEYYSNMSHSMRGDSDYAKFVTPDMFKLVAENIQNVTHDMPYSDEQFADAVLMLVRQISYVKSNVKYPAETIVENSGDCDVLSLLAASIMKAGGLDVVLLYYKEANPSHMNVGVYLPYTPVYRTWWMASASFEYNNKTYWMAECTSLAEWKVGDQPELLAGVKPEIISLKNCEESSPARVSSSLDSPLTPSSISISVSAENSTAGENWRTLTISGSISPAYSERSVVTYVNQDGYPSKNFKTVSPDDSGNYSLTWNFTSPGTYHIKTSLGGFLDYSGSDSETITVFMESRQQLGADDTLDYYWSGPDGVFARGNTSPLYLISASQTGKKFLQSNLTGTDILLSGEFIILSNGENATTPITEETITVPTLQTIRMPGRRGLVTIWNNEQITVTNEQATNQLGFTLQHNSGDNYTACVKVLSDDDVSRITEQLDVNNSALMNASVSTTENTWYKVAAKITDDEITAQLYDENGTLLKSLALNKSAVSSSESGILMTYNKGAAIAFRNLKAVTLDQTVSPIDNSQSSSGEFEPLVPYTGFAILLAVAIAMVVHVRSRRKAAPTQTKGS